jgi:hypothetical protein
MSGAKRKNPARWGAVSCPRAGNALGAETGSDQRALANLRAKSQAKNRTAGPLPEMRAAREKRIEMRTNVRRKKEPDTGNQIVPETNSTWRMRSGVEVNTEAQI